MNIVHRSKATDNINKKTITVTIYHPVQQCVLLKLKVILYETTIIQNTFKQCKMNKIGINLQTTDMSMKATELIGKVAGITFNELVVRMNEKGSLYIVINQYEMKLKQRFQRN